MFVKVDRYPDAMRQFDRNGVWGMCYDCPDADGEPGKKSARVVYPENCSNWGQPDHSIAATPELRSRCSCKLPQGQFEQGGFHWKIPTYRELLKTEMDRTREYDWEAIERNYGQIARAACDQMWKVCRCPQDRQRQEADIQGRKSKSRESSDYKDVV